MSLLEFFQLFEYSPVLVEMRASPWLFPAIASIHLLGLVVLAGSVLVVDLRLLGFGLSRQSAAQLARDTQPWLIAGLAVMLPSGLLLFMCFATKYYYLSAFWIKLASLAVVVPLTFSVHRRVATSPDTHVANTWSKPVAIISLSLWLCVALSGRLIGFP